MLEHHKHKHKFYHKWWFWTILAIFVVVVLIIIFNYLYDQNYIYSNYDTTYCSEGYTSCGGYCHSCTEGYYLGTDCECYPDEDKSYEIASEKWQEYISILGDDFDNLREAYGSSFCSSEYYRDMPACINYVSPILEIYAIHISEAEDFLIQEGNIIKNELTLQSSLDNEWIFVQQQLNFLKSDISEYNTWADEQNIQSEIDASREQAIYDTLRLITTYYTGY